MADIRVLTEKDLDDFIRLQIDAYPGMGMVFETDREKLRELIAERSQDERVSLYGYYRGDRMVGAMRTHDYKLNFRSAMISAGGLGGVAVDLTCKRERIAGDMVRYYLEKYDRAQAPMAVLWPFRPDFYRKMGFGYGGKKYRYALLPHSLPDDAGKAHIGHAVGDDFPAIARCYRRIFMRRTGLIEETEQTLRGIMGAHNGGKGVVFRDSREVRGFMFYRFRRGTESNFVSNDLHVEECLYESPEVLGEFLAFLHSQRDQVRRVIFDTPDPDFHYVPEDPRNASDNLYPSAYHECATCAVGPMYRILDVDRLIGSAPEAAFGPGEVTITFAVSDRWWGRTEGATTVSFSGCRGKVVPDGRADVAIELDVADFSSLMIGAVRLSRLVEYRRARLSQPEWLEPAEVVLATRETPYCTTRF